ncbi:MAG: hypothetical protein ACR2JU_03275 [Nocardioidaceae bacterium]
MTTVLDTVAARRVLSPWAAPRLVGAVLAWITLVLVVDARAGIASQRVLGVATWGVLALLLARESALVRVQTLVVVAFASCVEYTFSPVLGVYLYRFDNVPAYVPPGHGLVYLAALAIGRTAFVRARVRGLGALVVVAGGCWSLYGVTLADRPDVLGAFWFLCLIAFLRWGPSPGLYVGAFVVVSYLELVGTSLGTWAWQPHDPTGLVSMGNPPSGAAGGYGWFDLAATLLGPALLVRIRSLTGRRRQQDPPPLGSAGS